MSVLECHSHGWLLDFVWVAFVDDAVCLTGLLMIMSHDIDNVEDRLLILVAVAQPC